MNTKTTLVILGMSVLSAAAYAQADLNLTYTENPLGGGVFSYNMTLSVDQTGGAFTSGMGWTWITFGDVANNGASPLADFSMTSGFPGPFGQLAFSGGGHDGPTWLFDAASNIVYWTPSSSSDTISWTGNSSYDASTQGSMYFSELLVQGGGGQDNFKLMQPAAPEPASLLGLLGAGALLVRRRAKK